jgi:methionyl-tRNA formyltransferase
MGTPGLAVPALDALHTAGHEIAAVVTQPDRGRGRGRKVTPCAVKCWALDHEIPVEQPLKIRKPEFLEKLSDYKADVIVVLAYGRILPKSILDMPEHKCVNIHASLLPKYRGGAPINWALINGEKKTGITIMLMEEGLDTGPILSKKAIDIEPDDNSFSLGGKLADLGAEMIVHVLPDWAEGRINPVNQDETAATLAPLLHNDTLVIDWNKSAYKIECLVRGLAEMPAARSAFNEKNLKIIKAVRADEMFDGKTGEILVTKKNLYVKCGDGEVLELQSVIPAGGKRMSGAEFARGHRLKNGDSFVNL